MLLLPLDIGHYKIGSISLTVHAFHTISNPYPNRSARRLLDLGSVIALLFDGWQYFPSKGRGNGGVDYRPIFLKLKRPAGCWVCELRSANGVENGWRLLLEVEDEACICSALLLKFMRQVKIIRPFLNIVGSFPCCKPRCGYCTLILSFAKQPLRGIWPDLAMYTGSAGIPPQSD